MTEKLFFRILLVTFVLGTLFRLFPIFVGQPALSHFFITEDGYLLLTVSRNLAIGLGMTVSAGTIPTNGVQPLATFIFTLPYLATGGDKVTSLIGIHLIMTVIAIAGIFAVRAFAARALDRETTRSPWPWLAAGLWYVGPKLVRHTMNGLETGLYMLFVLLTLLQFARLLEKGDAARPRDRLTLGALCGLTFLARNDGVFLVIAIFAIWSLHEFFTRRSGLAQTFSRIVPAGLVSLGFAAPWLINNQLRFGSIVPISGQSEALTARFGQNLFLVPAKLFEDIFPMLPIPSTLAGKTTVIILATLIVAAVVGLGLRRIWRRGGVVMRLVVAAYTCYGGLLVCYYGLYFGAPYFLTRYFAPLAPLLIVFALLSLRDLAVRLNPHRVVQIVAGAGSAGIVLSLLLLGRQLLPTAGKGHFQVVAWVDKNVSKSTWVGAVQTGTLGYWHDRTINLDGKVNPAALAARRSLGTVLPYVLTSPIVYLVDWVGIASWAHDTTAGFNRHFKLLLKDPAANLAVLKRQG